MTSDPARRFLQELTNNTVATATSLHEATLWPGTVCEVDEDLWFSYLETLPPQFMDSGAFCFAEGHAPWLLFWRRAGRFLVRQLTRAETNQLALYMGLPLPEDW